MEYLYVLDAEGCPRQARDLSEWEEFMRDSNRVLAFDKFKRVWVQTTFAACAARDFLKERGPGPWLYDTFVMGWEYTSSNIHRYKTRGDALAGHAKILADIRKES